MMTLPRLAVLASCLGALIAACAGPRDTEQRAECVGTVEGALTGPFTCRVEVRRSLATGETRISITQTEPDPPRPAALVVLPAAVAFGEVPVARTYSSADALVTWAVSMVSSAMSGYTASRSYPKLPDQGTIVVTLTDLAAGPEIAGETTYEAHGLFRAELVPVGEAAGTTGAVVVAGTF